MASLYEDGWRQGSIVGFDLPLDAIVLGASRLPERSSGTHPLWAVATQDCDLDRADDDDPDPGIELRPLFTQDPPSDWSIRSAKLRLTETETEYANASASRITAASRVLTAILAAGAVRRDIRVALDDKPLQRGSDCDTTARRLRTPGRMGEADQYRGRTKQAPPDRSPGP